MGIIYSHNGEYIKTSAILILITIIAYDYRL